jgi:hypothetical protein
LKQFAKALVARGGDPHHIKWVAMDMLHCYAKRVREQFPAAQIVYDRYHLMVMAGEALEEVRRSLQRQGSQLKGALWTLRGDPWNLDAEQQQTRIRLAQQYKPLGRAWRCAPPYKISMKLPTATVQSFSNAGVNGRGAVDWPPFANLLKPSDSTGMALLVTSNAGSPKERSKQSTASSNWRSNAPGLAYRNSKGAIYRQRTSEAFAPLACVASMYAEQPAYDLGSRLLWQLKFDGRLSTGRFTVRVESGLVNERARQNASASSGAHFFLT